MFSFIAFILKMLNSNLNRVLGLVILAAVVSGVDISSVFTICKEPNRDECLKGAINEALKIMGSGNKDLNTPAFEPMMIDGIAIAPGLGTVHVEQHYKNIKLHNFFTGSEVKEVKTTITPDGFDMFVDLFSPEYRMEADYTFNGRILLLPIKGDGPCVLLLDNIESKGQVSADTYEKDGKTYAKIKKVTMNWDPQKLVVKFDNLFNGDKNLGDNMNKLMNENWHTIYHDVKTSYEEMVAGELLKYGNMILENFEYNTIFP